MEVTCICTFKSSVYKQVKIIKILFYKIAVQERDWELF